MKKGLIITIDGPAASGKSTVAKILAKRLKYQYIDSGAMYRALAFAAREQGIAPEDEVKLSGLCQAGLFEFLYKEGEFKAYYQGRDITQAIRTESVGEMASVYSLSPEVRAYLTDLQRRLAVKGGVVVEGRDAGTYVFPEADLKFYLMAGLEVRAERRQQEMASKGEKDIQLSQLAEEMNRRDTRDQDRALAPLTKTAAGIIIDSSKSSVNQVLEEVLGHVIKLELKAHGQ